MSTKKTENADLFKEALNELSEIKNSFRKKLELDILKENEKKINSIVEKLMEDDSEIKNDDTETEDNIEDSESQEITTDDNSNTEEITSDTEETGNDDQFNLSVIDNILADIDPVKMVHDLGKDVDSIEVETEVTYDDGKGSEEETPESEEVDENDLMEFYNKTKINNNETKMEDQNFETKPEAELTDDQIYEILKEMENDQVQEEDVMDENNDSDSDDTNINSDDEDITEEQIAAILAEMEVELEVSSEEKPEDEILTSETSPETEGSEEDELEENKGIGHVNAHRTNQKPEGLKDRLKGYRDTVRPYTINETMKKDFDKLKSKAIELINENKKLKEINTEAIKRLDNIKSKLYEATINSHKTSYVNQLFLENDNLSKTEKVQIIKEFINVDTIEKSKETFKKLNENFKNKEVISESIEDKISKSVVQSGASTLTETSLNESYTPQLQKMRQLMRDMEEKDKQQKR